jgi:hypothetical protein
MLCNVSHPTAILARRINTTVWTVWLDVGRVQPVQPYSSPSTKPFHIAFRLQNEACILFRRSASRVCRQHFHLSPRLDRRMLPLACWYPDCLYVLFFQPTMASCLIKWTWRILKLIPDMKASMQRLPTRQPVYRTTSVAQRAWLQGLQDAVWR